MPSTADVAGNAAFSCDDAVAGLFSAMFVVPQPPVAAFTVQVNDVVPVAPVPSWTVTTVVEVAAVVGVPEIRPEVALIDRPAGRPVAL